MQLEDFDGAARAQFCKSLCEHLSSGGGLEGAQVVVHSARAGSVIVEYDIVPPPGVTAAQCAEAAARSLDRESSAAQFAAAYGEALPVAAALKVQVIHVDGCATRVCVCDTIAVHPAAREAQSVAKVESKDSHALQAHATQIAAHEAAQSAHAELAENAAFEAACGALMALCNCRMFEAGMGRGTGLGVGEEDRGGHAGPKRCVLCVLLSLSHVSLFRSGHRSARAGHS